VPLWRAQTFLNKIEPIYNSFQAMTQGAKLETYRNSLGIAISVWKALLLREALARLFSSRAAWFWLIAEPVLHMAILGFIYSVIRQRTVGGIDTLIWLVLGLQGFFLFRRTATQMAGAIDSNRALFSYRQVKPTDTVLVRGFLEAVLMIMVITVIVAGLALLGHDVAPADPIAVLEAFFGLWLLGVGLGLIVSVVSELVPEIRNIMNMVMMPLYFLSGALVPIAAVPEPYRDWLLINPIVHGLDGARLGFAPYYHSVPGLDIAYLYTVALVSIFLGLILHRRYAVFMVTR
jgi:capsular polysaccharide transport system permease protein